MSSMIQPNGTPGRSPVPRRARAGAGGGAMLETTRAAAHGAYIAVYREALRALAAREITRGEYDRRLAEAGATKRRAVYEASRGIGAGLRD